MEVINLKLKRKVSFVTINISLKMLCWSFHL